MTFQNPFRNPMTAIPISMAFLILAILLPMLFHPASKSAQDWTDGVRGLLFGISIGIGLMSVVRIVRHRRSASG